MATSSLRAFWQSLIRFDASKISPVIAFRNTVGIAVPLVAAAVSGNPSAGVVAALGALHAAYSDGRDSYLSRARRMISATVLCSLAVSIGGLSAHANASAVAAATLWAFIAGMLVALGQRAADLGVITLVTLVVFAARPLTPVESAETGLLAFGGGLLQTLLSIAFWPVRRFEPERRMISSLYSTLSQIAVSPAGPASAPPASSQISEAQEALASLAGRNSEEADEYVFLLSQAERIRLSLLTLRRLARRLGREEQGREAREALNSILAGAAQALESVGQRVLKGGVENKPDEASSNFNEAVRGFRERDWPASSHFLAALVRDAMHQIDALAGQIRAATGLSATVIESMAQREAEKTWRLRFYGSVARLHANLSFQSTAFRHAVRLAASIGIGDAIGRGISVERTYWVPMTIAIVLRPDFASTFSRGILRLAGTFAGLLLATGLVHFLHGGVAMDILLVTLFTFIMRWVGAANYGVFVTAISSMVVLLIATTGVNPRGVIAARAVNTAIGGALALFTYAVWPTWERSRIGSVLAGLVEAYRDYFDAVVTALAGGNGGDLESLRRRARRTRSNTEASVSRIRAEPGVTSDQVNLLSQILVSLYTFVRSVMAMESAIYMTSRAPARPASLEFASRVDMTLDAIARSLRSSTPLDPKLPDLREAHNAIVQPEKATTERYTLINMETDRITISVNTLREQIAKWNSVQRG